MSELTLLLTLSSGESSVEVDTESEDMAEGGLVWAERSEREVEVLTGDKKTNHQEKSTFPCVSHYKKKGNMYIYVTINKKTHSGA